MRARRDGGVTEGTRIGRQGGRARRAKRAARARSFARPGGQRVPAVVLAAEELVRTPAPTDVESHAVLEVIADGEGRVVSVAVSDASQDREAWDAIARALLGSMGAKRVRVRVPALHGLAMTIALDSKEALPSGAAPGLTVKLFDHDLHSGKNERSNEVSILPLMKLPVLIPKRGMPDGVETKIITLPIPTPNVTARFDLVDIGSPAARSVHAHAVSEEESSIPPRCRPRRRRPGRRPTFRGRRRTIGGCRRREEEPTADVPLPVPCLVAPRGVTAWSAGG